MFKKLLFGIAAITALFHYSTNAQSLPYDNLKVERNTNKTAPCGTTADYISTLGVTGSTGGSGSIIIPSSFPSTAIDTCGKFRIFYEDLALTTGEGFDKGLGIGSNRRDILCQVLTDIQNQFDFSSIPSGQYIRLHIDTSFGATYHPAPVGTEFYARAGAFYLKTGTGIRDGYLNEFVRTGTDPISVTDDYHANLQVNFHQWYLRDDTGKLMTTGAIPVNFYESTSTSIGQCQTDLYSVLKHEVTHCLGWFSIIKISGTSLGTTIFSSIDTSAHVTNLSASNEFSTLTKAIASGSLSVSYPSKGFWINSKYPPYNHSIFGADARRFAGYVIEPGNFSHLNDSRMAYAYALRQSPGDYEDYIMTYFAKDGKMLRNYTKGELQTLNEILGYPYKTATASSTIITNHIPYSTKMNSPLFDGFFKGAGTDYSLVELLPADTTIINDSSVVYTYSLTNDTSFHDLDGDAIRIYPNSLVNIRGCGESGNNHNRLTISSDGKSIAFTPRHNFFGKSQWGFNIYDGKEKGAFHIVTVDVLRGNNVSALVGENLVLNGNFEEGTETKVRGDEGINNSSMIAGDFLGRLAGAHYADSHPQDWLVYPYYPWGGGTMIYQSQAECDSASTLTYSFGSWVNSFPKEIPLIGGAVAGVEHPMPPSGGSRYQAFFSNSHSAYYYLAEPLESCKRYVLEFDAYSALAPLLSKVPHTLFTIGFTDSAKANLNSMDVYTTIRPNLYKLDPDFDTLLDNSWAHIKIPFSFCSDTTADILSLTLKSLPNIDLRIFIDNLSIKEDTSKPTLAIIDTTLLPCHDTRLTASALGFNKYHCSGFGDPDFYWVLGTDTISTDSIIFVAPELTSDYIAIVTDGCITLRDTVTVIGSIGVIVKAKDTTICYGQSALLTYSVSGATGTVYYSWTPSTGLSCTTCANPVSSVLSTTKYTLTVSDSFTCFEHDITVNVRPKLDWYISNDTSICAGRTAMLTAFSGSNTLNWTPSTGLSCTSCDTTYATPASTTDYILGITDAFGCRAYDTVKVTVNPLPVVSISATPPSVCGGTPVLLTASGGISYEWHGTPFLTCLACASPFANPPTDQTFTVVVRDIKGCLAIDSIRIKVRNKPVVYADAPTGICMSGSAAVTGHGAKDYTWQTLAGTTTGIACPTCATTTITPTSATYYVLTGTDTNGCSNKDTFLIDVYALPTVSVTTPIINICTTDSLTLTATGASNYSWSPTTGFTCPTCNPAKVIAPSTTATYIVTGTDTNGCTDTGKVVINANVCPCTPASVFGTTASTLTTGTLPTTVSSGYYYLPNDLTINSNTTMTGAKILIERGVTITVANNAKLTLDSCHLFTCDEDTAKGMWRGIILATGTSSSGRIEVRNNCLIEDALFAIDAITLRAPSSGDIVSVTNSTFNRNQVDISLNDYKVASPAILPFTIKGNLFTARKFSRTTMTGYPNTWTGTATLKATTSITDSKAPYYISKTTALSKALCKDASIFSYVGVRTNNIGVTSSAGVYQSEIKIGEGASVDDYNLFDNHQYGVVSYNSNITLYHNHFINISRRMTPSSSTTAPVGNGMAVILQADKTNNTRAQVLPSAFGNMTNKFHDCFMGIYTENVTTLNISNTNMTTGNLAGAVVAGAAYTTETYSGYGIMLHCEGIQKSTTISSNTISNVNVGIQYGIINPKAGDVSSVSNNFLYGANPDPDYASFRGRQCMSKGIDIYTSSGVKGTANTLTINNNTVNKVFNGILLQGLTNVKCSTTNNTITIWDTITPVTSSIQYGIQANSNNEMTISANPISSYSGSLTSDRIRGVMAGSNTVLRICGNTTTKIGRGFEFSKGYAQTGTRWIGNTINDGYKGIILASDIGDQGFTYNDATYIPRTFYGATLNKWNISGSGKYETFVEGTIKSKSSKLFVKNITTTGIVELPATNWGSPPTFRYLYSGLSGSLLTTQTESNCLGAIFPIKYNPIPGPWGGSKLLGALIIADSLDYDSSYNVRQWMSQLSLYELGTIDPELRDSSTILDSFMIEAAGSRFGWLTDIESAINNDDFSTAQTLLDNPVSAMGRVVINGDLIITDYEDADEVVENYTNFYTAYLQFLQGTMTDSDTARILSIAQKCPVKDGAVVYKARALQQRLSFDYIVYNDDSCEFGNGSNYRISPNSTLTGRENTYFLFPNPNNGVFAIKQSIVDDKEVSVRLYNAVGVQIANEKVQFNNGMANFKVQNASAGLYLFCLTDEENKTVCLKFNIQ